MAFPPPAAHMGIPLDDSVPQAQPSKPDNAFCMSNPFDVLFPCNTCFIMPERVQIVQLYFGNYHGTITEPGCYCRSGFAIELRRVSTDIITHDLANIKVLDARGSPVVISGIITYQIVNARAAAIDVSDPHRFVRDQAPAILKRVAAMYPYESEKEGDSSLRSDALEIGERMRDTLQNRVAVAGIKVESFNVNELSYAPEIASVMLKRQQADALVAARKSIVKGAKLIAMETVGELGADMSPAERAKLLANLLLVLVGEKEVTPTLQV